MLRDRLREKIQDDQSALGCTTNDPDMVELMAHMGFDWFLIDQMFTANDWSRTELLLRTGEAAGITPVVRVQSNPWMGYDPRIVVDVTRAMGVGAKYIFVSNANNREIEQAAEASHDWHRKCVHIHPFNSIDEWEAKIDAITDHTYIIPQPETKEALAGWEEAFAIPEIKMYFFAMTDASRALADSDKPDWYSKELWSMVDDAVAKGKETGVVVGGNTSYAYDMAEMANRAALLHDHGVRMILLQPAAFLFQIAVGAFLKDVRSRIAR